MRKVSPDEKEWLARFARERIGEAVAEVQLSRVAGSFPVIPVRLTRNSRVSFGHRLNDQVRS